MPDSTFQSDFMSPMIAYCIGKWYARCKEAANQPTRAFKEAVDSFRDGLQCLENLFNTIPEGQAIYAKGQLISAADVYAGNFENWEEWRLELLRQAA